VLVIDNSRSIREDAQKALVRETTQLLADLADVGDRVAVVTFGESSRMLVSTTFRTDGDRTAFKEAVRQSLDFTENWSDIRAGVRLVAEGRDTFFRPEGQSKRVVVVLSDGRLEPPKSAGTPAQALAEIDGLFRDALKGVDTYAIALAQPGTESAREVPGLGALTGQQLMETRIARASGRYFQAESLDELLDITLLILKKAKGINSLGENRGVELMLDDTVRAASFIVRKRSSLGEELTGTAQIRLRAPGPSAEGTTLTATDTAGAPAASVYWSSDYATFDLIVVRQPRQGRWRIALADGRAPSVLTRVVTPVELAFDARPVYYLNEAAHVSAWLVNNDTGTVIASEKKEELFRVQMRVIPADGGFSPDSPAVGLDFDAASGQYHGAMPAAVPEQLRETAGRIKVQFVAHRRSAPGSEKTDEWFVRLSPEVTVDLAKPFTSWAQMPRYWLRVPLWGRVMAGCEPPPAWPLQGLWRNLPCGLPRRGGTLEATLPAASRLKGQLQAPVFGMDALPDITAEVETFDAGSGRWQAAGGARHLTRASESEAHVYRGSLEPVTAAEYRYRYVLEGNADRAWSAERALRIQSEWFATRARSIWPELLGLLLVAAFIACRLAGRRVRLAGKVTVLKPYASIPLTGKMTFDSSEFPAQVNQAMRGGGFTLGVRTRLCLSAHVLLRVERGQATLDGGPVGAGQAVVLKHRLQTLVLNGVQVQLDVRAR